MKQKNKWKKLLCSLCMILFVSLLFSKVAVQAEEVTEDVSESMEQAVSETEEQQELSFTDHHFTTFLNKKNNV